MAQLCSDNTNRLCPDELGSALRRPFSPGMDEAWNSPGLALVRAVVQGAGHSAPSSADLRAGRRAEARCAHLVAGGAFGKPPPAVGGRRNPCSPVRGGAN